MNFRQPAAAAAEEWKRTKRERMKKLPKNHKTAQKMEIENVAFLFFMLANVEWFDSLDHNGITFTARRFSCCLLAS